jgi:uncharacterized membrane protein required for colicin V production
VDIGGAIRGAPFADLVVVVGLGVFFFLGVLQGSIRRLLGIASLLFAFVVAANVSGPGGDFLADNWRQFDRGYNHLLAFLIVFVLVVVLLNIVIQAVYKRTEINARHPIVDDILGGLLGLLEGFVLLLFLVIILNSYILPGARAGDLSQLRDLQNAVVHESHIARGIHETIAPLVVHLLSILLPSDLVKSYN